MVDESIRRDKKGYRMKKEEKEVNERKEMGIIEKKIESIEEKKR